MKAEGRLEMRKFVVPEFVFGDGALTLTAQYVRNFTARKVLIVTDPGIIKAGWTSKIETEFNHADIPYIIFSELTPNPKDYEVMEGARLYNDEDCDMIIAIGGGSPMDCAKAIGIVCTNHKHVLEFEGVDEVKVPGPPLICIPTTAGTGADISQFSIITDTERKVKIAIISKTMVPDVSLIDPVTTTTKNLELTAATGMDALAHAFEAFVSNASSKITDLHSLEAVKLIRRNLELVYKNPNNLKYREKMMLASLFAGMAFSNARLGLVHGMAHSLGGWLDLAHGDCNAILLEHVVDLNFEHATEKYTILAEAMGIDLNRAASNEVKKLLISSIKELRHKVGINKRLGDLGVKIKDIKQLSRNASADPCLATNPILAEPDEIEKVYEKAL